MYPPGGPPNVYFCMILTCLHLFAGLAEMKHLGESPSNPSSVDTLKLFAPDLLRSVRSVLPLITLFARLVCSHLP